MKYIIFLYKNNKKKVRTYGTSSPKCSQKITISYFILNETIYNKYMIKYTFRLIEIQ